MDTLSALQLQEMPHHDGITWLDEDASLAGHSRLGGGFPPELAALVGYQQHRPNLGNFEGQCPSVLLGPNVPERLAATDALRPDQEELLAQFVRDQDWPGTSAAA